VQWCRVKRSTSRGEVGCTWTACTLHHCTPLTVCLMNARRTPTNADLMRVTSRLVLSAMEICRYLKRRGRRYEAPGKSWAGVVDAERRARALSHAEQGRHRCQWPSRWASWASREARRAGAFTTKHHGLACSMSLPSRIQRRARFRRGNSPFPIFLESAIKKVLTKTFPPRKCEQSRESDLSVA